MDFVSWGLVAVGDLVVLNQDITIGLSTTTVHVPKGMKAFVTGKDYGVKTVKLMVNFGEEFGVPGFDITKVPIAADYFDRV
jgi:hypothetical protein